MNDRIAEPNPSAINSATSGSRGPRTIAIFGANSEIGAEIAQLLERPDETIEALEEYYGSQYSTGLY